MHDLTPINLLTQLRLKHLRLLDVLARTANLHRAAAELNVTQPAATKILQGLEEMLGIALFDRTPRAMVPTEIGAYVVEYARRTSSEGERFALGLANLKQGGYGSLSVGAIMATAPDLLPQAIAELKRRRPLMTIQVLAATSDQLVAALERGQPDLVIGRVTAALQLAKLNFEPLSKEELWAFVAASHPLAKTKSVDLVDLEQTPWVLQPAPSPMRHLIDTAFAAAGLRTLDNLVEATSIFATLHLVRRAGMIAVLPSTIVADEVQRGDFVRLLLRFKTELDQYGIITRREELPTSNAAEFISIVRELAKPTM